KFSRNGIAGIGISYQFGTGHEIRKIAFTNQGFSLRSFLDWKIEKNTYATGGFEFSYRPSMPVTDAWNPALMAGITRQQKISSRFKAKCSLLLNAFYKKGGSPNPFIFRFGYSL
ncbi:MAG TPA: hypothetical protein VD996_11195, partial [Chitinophagaceae bacterium]|nr:hypothetical protein [Chitinophagaceae bacterium]